MLLYVACSFGIVRLGPQPQLPRHPVEDAFNDGMDLRTDKVCLLPSFVHVGPVHTTMSILLRFSLSSEHFEIFCRRCRRDVDIDDGHGDDEIING